MPCRLLGLGEAALAGGVERGRLVRVLAVAQDVLAREGVAEELGQARVAVGGVVGREPGGDSDVVGGGVLERLGGEPLAGGQVEAAGLDRGEDVGVPLGAGDDGDRRVVLGGGADHRGATDVDLLDALVVGGARGDRLLERVEVHHDQVEGLDAELGELLAVGVETEVGEDAGVDAGVQRLDAAVQALGEAGELLDLGDRYSGGGDLPGGGAGGDEFDARLVQTAGEVFEPRLVVDTDQGAADGLIHRHDRDEPFVPQCDGRHGRSAPRPRRAASARLP